MTSTNQYLKYKRKQEAEFKELRKKWGKAGANLIIKAQANDVEKIWKNCDDITIVILAYVQKKLSFMFYFICTFSKCAPSP